MSEFISGLSGIGLGISLSIILKIGSNHDHKLLERVKVRLAELIAENEKLKNDVEDAQRIIDIMGAMIAGKGDHPHLPGNY